MSVPESSTISRSAEGSPRPVGSGSVSGSFAPDVVCRHCHGANPGSRKFCGHCGKSLWEPCPKCQVDGPATETFCGHCGTNITALYQERQGRFEAELARVGEMRQVGDYEESLRLAAALIRTNSLRLESQVALARKLIAEITAERDQRLGLAETVLAKAREHQSKHAYETAVSVLEEIPASLRSDEFQTFYDQVRSQWKEVLSLGGEIRQLLEAKRTLEMLPKLDRLIQLQPEHAQARQLAEQLRDRYIQAVKKKLAVHRYPEALALAQDIPPLVRTPEVEDLQVRAAELAWLHHDLVTSPVVDKSLLAVAERLVKFAPGNEQAVKLLAQLKERAKMKPKSPRAALPPWAAAAEKTRLGLPLDWLGGFERLSATKEAAAVLADHPGCLFVAAGLALQGVELAAINVNLLPREKTSRFAALNMNVNLNLLGKKKKQVRRAWGLDLTDTGLKAIKLVCDEESESVTIEACEVIEHKKPVGQSEPSESAGGVAATLEAFREKHDLSGCKVCVSLSSSKLLARFLQLPPVAKKQVPGVVEYEAKHQIPFPLTELVWDYELLDEEAENYRDDVQHRVLLLAAKEFHVVDQLAALKAAEINVDLLQSDAVALHNLALYEFFEQTPDPTTRRRAIGLIDIGSDSTNVVVSWPGGAWFRGSRCGGDDFTRAIVRQFKLTHPQAEQLKRDPTKARRLSQLYEALEPQFAELTKEIERSLAAYENERTGVRIERLYALGGGLLLHGLWRHLRLSQG